MEIKRIEIFTSMTLAELENYVKNNDVDIITNSGFIIPLSFDQYAVDKPFFVLTNQRAISSFNKFDALKVLEHWLEFDETDGNFIQFDVSDFNLIENLLNDFGGIKEIKLSKDRDI